MNRREKNPQIRETEIQSPYLEESHLDIVNAKHRRRLDFIMLAIGACIAAVILAVAVFAVQIPARREIWLVVMLAFGLAAMSVGIAGAFSVEFKKKGLMAQGTLGFGVFLVVVLTCLWANHGC